MQKISDYLSRWPVALLVTILLGAAILLPSLGGPGLWEMSERSVSDRVAPPHAIQRQQDEARRQADEAQKKAQANQPKPPASTCKKAPPDDAYARTLTSRAIKLGRDEIGDSDAGRRLPLALLGLLTVIATAGIGMRLGRARAGIVTAVVLLSMPLLVLQSRMLTSDIGTACGAALIIYGFLALRSTSTAIGALAGARMRELGVATADLVVGALSLCAGLVIGFVAGGALMGLLVPIGAIAAAGKLGLPFILDAGRLGYNSGLRIVRRSRWAIGKEPLPYGGGGDYGPALLATLAAIGLVIWLAYQLYSLEPPRPGFTPPVRQIAGTAIVNEGCYSWLLGGVWRPEDDLRYVFDSSFEQIAYGTFPWGILGPIAMLLLLRDADPKRRLAGALTLAWAGGAWIATEAFHRKVGITIWSGFPAIAVAIGVWIDGVLEARARREAGAALPAGAILLGLFVLLAVLDFGKDIQAFPDKLTSLLTGTEVVTYPVESKLLFLKTRLWVLALGMCVALGVGLALILWRTGDDARAARLRRVAMYCAAGAFGASIVIAGFWAFAWHPRLAESLSSKALFETYKDLRQQGDQLVIMGELGNAPLAYADTAKGVRPEELGYEKAPGREAIVAALKRTNRVFAIAPVAELCTLHREIGDKPYFVIDDRNTRNLLFSNKLDGARDKNPLRDMIVHTAPEVPTKPKGKVVWDNRIELLGWKIPPRIQRGSTFEVVLYYKILQPVGGNWTSIMHFDGAIRFSGDHKPIQDRCPTSTWQKDDYIIDRVNVVAGGAGHPLGKYDLWIGFFTGSAPNFKNMTVSAAPADMKDTTDRVKITSVILD